MRHQAPLKRLSPDARAALLRHPWPGNVRELRQVILRAWVAAEGAVISQDDLGLGGANASVPGQPAIVSLAAVERAHILRVLEHCGGNKKAAAELLEIDRSTLYAKLKQYGMS
jgi:two-component system NtrC family response regulator